MIAIPCLGQIIHDLIDLIFCSHIDAPCGIVHDQHLWLGHKPFRNHDFLLVATGQGIRRGMQVGRLDRQALCKIHAFLQFGQIVDPHEGCEPIQVGQ